MKQIERICLIVNFNLYESKRYFTKHLSNALKRKGVNTIIIDANQSILSSETIQTIRNFAPNYTCSFNSFESLSGGGYLWDYLKIPHISFLVDPSFYSTSLTKSAYSILTCVDRSDCKAIESSGFEKVFFWPHAVEKELGNEKTANKPYDVVFLGSCYDYENIRTAWQEGSSKKYGQVLDNAIDIVFSDESASLAEALVASWNASGLDPQGVDFAQLYTYLDSYTRGFDRIELIRSIKDAKVHVFGDLATENAVGIMGWKHYLAASRNVTVHPPVLFEEGLNILKKSKIVLNSMPFFRDGSHERIFTGFACGCLPITSESKYLREQFVPGKELLFYSASARKDVNGLLNDWLIDERKREDAATLGREKVMQHHTWDNRAEVLLQKLKNLF